MLRFSVYDIATLAAIIGIAVSSVGYADIEGTEKYLRDDGYTEINVIGRRFVGCSGSMTFYRTEFTAKNSRGIDVRGVACRGLISEEIIIARR